MTFRATRAWTPSVTGGATVAPIAAQPTDDLPPGTVVGEYVIERQLGAGGMGVVFGARHPIIGKRAAIKVLNARYSADPQAVARFVQEAQAVNQIGDGSIVDVFAFGTLPDGRVYFVMEWLAGESLQDRLARGPVPLADALAILASLARAVEAVHSAGVVHRDLKPDNVFLLGGDHGPRIKLLDFGIAKLESGTPELNRTATGVVMGTPLFMSPEQARGEHIDARTDLYALGVIAYQLVCGETPFEREPSAIEILAAHICKPPPLVTSVRPDTPPALEALIQGLLAKAPAERPPLAEVRQRLAAIAAAMPAAGAAPPASGAMTSPDVAPPFLEDSSPGLRVPGYSTPISVIQLAVPPATAAPRAARRRMITLGAAALAGSALVAFAIVTTTRGPVAPAAAEVGGAAPIALHDGPRARVGDDERASRDDRAATARRGAADDRGAETGRRADPDPDRAADRRGDDRAAADAHAIDEHPAADADGADVDTHPSRRRATRGVAILAIEPPSATVLLDDQPVALVRGHARLELPAGPHTLTVRARGRIDDTRALAITAGDETAVAVHLERKHRSRHRVDVDAVVNPFAHR